MNNESTIGLKDIADDSILLDSNVIFSLFTSIGQRQYDTDIKLKIAAVTCENFLILENTLQELYQFATRQKKKIYPNFANQIETESLQPPKDFEKILDTLLSRKIFKIVRHGQIKEIFESFQPLDYFQGSRLKHKFAQASDKVLILTSKFFSVPIFTYDFDIISIANKGHGSTIAEFNIPFPFDIDELKDVELDEILDLATPLRRLYRKAFSKIKEEVSTSEKLKENLKNKNDFIKRQREILVGLNSDLIETKNAIQKWKNLAKPNITETITWTMVELGLGFVPFPVPTSPINHFIQSIRYRKLDHDND